MVASVQHIACLGYLIRQMHDAPNNQRDAVNIMAQSILGIRDSNELATLKKLVGVWPSIASHQASFDHLLKAFQERVPELEWRPPKDSVEGMMLAQIEKSRY